MRGQLYGDRKKSNYGKGRKKFLKKDVKQVWQYYTTDSTGLRLNLLYYSVIVYFICLKYFSRIKSGLWFDGARAQGWRMLFGGHGAENAHCGLIVAADGR